MTAEIAKTETETSRSTARFVWIFFGFITIFVYFFGLTFPFVGPDEPRYAQVAREMVDRGDWITPTLGGFPWFEKPPLLYWLAIVSYKLFGVSEFAARFGPALCGLGTVACLWILGRSVSKEPEENDFANWLTLVGASTLGIIVFSHAASTDIVVTFPMTAALISYFIFDHRSRLGGDTGSSEKRHVFLPLFLFYFFIGLALLAKGLIGLVFPFAIVALYHLLSRKFPSRRFLTSLIWGIAMSVAIACVWYLPMYMRHGDTFIDEFIVQHHFQRFTSNKYEHPQPIYFYIWVLPLMTLPWLPFFLTSIWKIGKRLFHHRDTKGTKEGSGNTQHLLHSSSPLLLFLLAWLLVPLTFFSFSGSKLPGYILPTVPAAIILTAIFVFHLVQRSNKWRAAIMLTAAATFCAVILVSIFAVPRYAGPETVKHLLESAKSEGYPINRVLGFQAVSHNAEFYAAGRLLRDENGKQRQLEDVSRLVNAITAENGQSVVVLVPLGSLSQLMTDKRISITVIEDNGDLAIALVKLR